MPKIPYESLDDSSDSLESTDEQGTSRVVDETVPKETGSRCSVAQGESSKSAVGKDKEDGESSCHASSFVQSPSETKLKAILQQRKRPKSETRMTSFTLPAPPITKQPMVNYFEAPASQWSRFIFDPSNFRVYNDIPTSSGAFLGSERSDRTSRDRSQRRLRSGYRWDMVGSSLMRQDTAQVTRRLRVKFNSMIRKQRLLEQANAEFSEEIKSIREELRNAQQSANEERSILRKQLAELQEYVRQASVAEKQRDMLLSSISELKDNVKVLQLSFDRHVEEHSYNTRKLLIENNNLLNDMKTIQDENRQLHKALNAERSKLQRNRQILIRRNTDPKLPIRNFQSNSQSQRGNSPYNETGTNAIPLSELEEGTTRESAVHENQEQSNLPAEDATAVKRVTDRVPDVSIPLTSASSNNDEGNDNTDPHDCDRPNEPVPEHGFRNSFSLIRFNGGRCRYKMAVIYSVLLILAIFLGTLLPVPWRL